jgi:hypothetical protein
MARNRELEDKTIIASGNQNLIRGLERFRQRQQGREVAMVENIYKYCRENPFNTGIFLVGAEHKAGVIKEVEKHAGMNADLITWNFGYFAA